MYDKIPFIYEMIQEIVFTTDFTEFQQRSRQKNADKDQEYAAHQTQHNGRMNGILHALFIPRTVPLGRQHVGADGKPHKHIDQQIDDRALVCADSRQSLRSCKTCRLPRYLQH